MSNKRNPKDLYNTISEFHIPLLSLLWIINYSKVTLNNTLKSIMLTMFVLEFVGFDIMLLLWLHFHQVINEIEVLTCSNRDDGWETQGQQQYVEKKKHSDKTFTSNVKNIFTFLNSHHSILSKKLMSLQQVWFTEMQLCISLYQIVMLMMLENEWR